jgi:hypothetical protein
MLLSIPGRRFYKEAFRTLRFRCARGVKHFSQRAQLYTAGATFVRINDSKTNAYFFLNQGHYRALLILRRSRFSVSLWLVRSQATVDDVSYMKAMIPHHSMAIMTRKRAQIEDHRVRSLADEIIESQNREIIEMKTLIKELGNKKYLPPDI